MVDGWYIPKYPNYVRPGSVDDPPELSPADYPKTFIRAHKDQEMDDQAQKKPWTLKAAKNWVSGLRSTTKGVNPKDQLGAAKVPMHLVPTASVVMQALCMDDGNIKYGPYNWRMEPIQAVGYIAAAKRHLDAYMDGQEYDSVTGKPHLGYALATIGIVIDAWLNGTLIDNRPVLGIGGILLDRLAYQPGETDRSPEQLRMIFEEVAAIGAKQTRTRNDQGVDNTLQEGSRVQREEYAMDPRSFRKAPT